MSKADAQLELGNYTNFARKADEEGIFLPPTPHMCEVGEVKREVDLVGRKCKQLEQFLIQKQRRILPITKPKGKVYDNLLIIKDAGKSLVGATYADSQMRYEESFPLERKTRAA